MIQSEIDRGRRGNNSIEAPRKDKAEAGMEEAREAIECWEKRKEVKKK